MKNLCSSQAGLCDEHDAAASNMDWLDNLSESGSSNISKIDWAAIERMVATGEAWAEEKLYAYSTLKVLWKKHISATIKKKTQFKKTI